MALKLEMGRTGSTESCFYNLDILSNCLHFQSLYIQISTIMHSEFLCYSSIHIDFTVYKETSTTRNQKTAIILVELGFANLFDYLGMYAILSS